MTIVVKRNGVTVSGIHFMAMSPWDRAPKIITHSIDGASFDIIHHAGMHSASCTLTGYCRRSADNVATLNGLKDGSQLTIVHDVEGTRSGMCTALTPVAAGGGLYINFSMTIVEQ